MTDETQQSIGEQQQRLERELLQIARPAANRHGRTVVGNALRNVLDDLEAAAVGADAELTADQIRQYVREHVTDAAPPVYVSPRPGDHVGWSWDVIAMTIDHPEALGEQLERELALELYAIGGKSDAFDEQYAGVVIQLEQLADSEGKP